MVKRLEITIGYLWTILSLPIRYGDPDFLICLLISRLGEKSLLAWIQTFVFTGFAYYLINVSYFLKFHSLFLGVQRICILCWFFRYSAGQHFGRHIDESVDLEDGKRTYYTLLIYLSGSNNAKSKSKSSSSSKTNDSSSAEPLVGGETVFYGSRNSIVAEVTTPK